MNALLLFVALAIVWVVHSARYVHRVDDTGSRLTAVLIRNCFSFYDAVQYCWANANSRVDLSNNSVAQWVECNES